MKAAILTDLTRCRGCQACALACRESNGLPASAEATRLDEGTWTFVEKVRGLNVRRQCMHCEDPACASVCPVGALHKTEAGPVVYDAAKCMGCRYCMLGCPFGVPTFEWNSPAPRVRKCLMCYETRLMVGRQPACTEACPAGATIFGDRDELVAEARRRIEAEPGRYVDRIYGLQEAGGTSVLYLSPVPFEELGFRNVRTDPYSKLTWEVLSKLPTIVSVGGVMMFGIYWIVNRRQEVADAEASSSAREE